MAKFDGVATVHMSMPMVGVSLPIYGQCTVEDKKVQLRFPLSSVTFDLPHAPAEGGSPMEVKMQGARGETTLRIQWQADMKAFKGQAIQDGYAAYAFVFFRPDSPLKLLKTL